MTFKSVFRSTYHYTYRTTQGMLQQLFLVISLVIRSQSIRNILNVALAFQYKLLHLIRNLFLKGQQMDFNFNLNFKFIRKPQQGTFRFVTTIIQYRHVKNRFIRRFSKNSLSVPEIMGQTVRIEPTTKSVVIVLEIQACKILHHIEVLEDPILSAVKETIL